MRIGIEESLLVEIAKRRAFVPQQRTIAGEQGLDAGIERIERHRRFQLLEIIPVLLWRGEDLAIGHGADQAFRQVAAVACIGALQSLFEIGGGVAEGAIEFGLIGAEFSELTHGGIGGDEGVLFAAGLGRN